MFVQVVTMLIVGAVMAVTPRSGRAEEPLWVRVAPEHCFDPCEIWVTVGTEPDEENRELLLEADNGFFFRSSTIQLDGDDEPTVHRVLWKSMPAGHYAVRVVLTRSDGDVVLATEHVLVIGAVQAGPVLAWQGQAGDIGAQDARFSSAIHPPRVATVTASYMDR